MLLLCVFFPLSLSLFRSDVRLTQTCSRCDSKINGEKFTSYMIQTQKWLKGMLIYITGGSCYKYNFCCDNSFVMTNMCLSRQNMSFVATEVCLSWQMFCHDKPVLLQENICHDKYLSRQIILSWQMFCCDKHTFVATKHIFCCDKSMSWQSYELSVRVVAVVLTRCGWRWKSGDPGRWAALLYPELTVCQSYPWMESETHRHTTPTSSTDNSCFTSNALPFCVVIMKHHLYYQCELLSWWNITYITNVNYYHDETSPILPMWIIIMMKHDLYYQCELLSWWNMTYITNVNYYHDETSPILPMWIIIMMKHHLYYQCELLSWWNITYITNVNHYHDETSPILPMWIIIMMKHHLYYQCESLSWWNITYITNVNHYHDETSPILPMWIIIMMKHCCSTLWPWSITYIIVLHCNHKRLLMISCHAKIIQCHFCNCLHYNHRASLMLLFCIIIMKHHLSFCSMITKHH